MSEQNKSTKGFPPEPGDPLRVRLKHDLPLSDTLGAVEGAEFDVVSIEQRSRGFRGLLYWFRVPDGRAFAAYGRECVVLQRKALTSNDED